MKILIVIGKYPNYGGTEVVTTVLANSFVKKGYAVTIASFEQTVPELSSELDPSIVLRKLSYPVITPKNIKVLKKIILDNEIDFILNQWCLPFYVTVLCNMAIGKTNCKLISVMHGVPDKNKRTMYFENKMKSSKNRLLIKVYEVLRRAMLVFTSYNSRYVYDNSSAYVVLSKSFINTFVRFSGLKNTSKLITIGNPLTISDQEFGHDSSSKEKIILYVGRIDYTHKRVHRIIEVWEKMYGNYPDWKLVIVGDGPEKSNLETYVEQNKITGVHFEGFTNKPPTAYYKKSSILILTSDLESFGLVLTEAMSYGMVPVVYGSYTAVYDIVTDGKSGFITSMPYSEEETINKLRELMSDENKLDAMAKEALRKSQDFSLEMVLTKWEALFSTLNNKK
ncbi:glycosyltransferase [Maribacter chungangensis]|uniref:Glycosyltransferase n=1 Tax=Maribacter chungangensis TaxID=1069117 RepID=A0ABW3B4F6_9FLAO